MKLKKNSFLLTLIIIISANLHGFNYSEVLKNNKANKLYKEGDYSQSKELYQENSIRNPQRNELQFNLGDAYYKSQDFEKALSAFNKALQDQELDKSMVNYN